MHSIMKSPISASLSVGWVATAFLLATTMGCANHAQDKPMPMNVIPTLSGPPAAPAPVREIPHNPTPRNLKLPLDAFILDDTQRRNIFLATEALQQKCMNAKGYSYNREKPLPLTGPIGNELRYGSADPQIAAKYGYGFPPDRDPATHKKLPSGNENMPDAAYKALMGFAKGTRDPAARAASSGGCIGEAERRLEQESPRVANVMLAQQLSQQSFIQSMEDKRVKKVFHRWSTCMKHKGFSYKNPMDPAKDFASLDPPTKTARTAASTDVACKQSSNLVGIWYAVEKAFQEGSVQKYAPELKKIRMLNKMILETASVIH